MLNKLRNKILNSFKLIEIDNAIKLYQNKINNLKYDIHEYHERFIPKFLNFELIINENVVRRLNKLREKYGK